jgi:lipoprotein signal peptidase
MVPWLVWAAIVAVLDQFTKTLILGYYQLGDSTTITRPTMRMVICTESVRVTDHMPPIRV